jgi:hypothetical protein
VKDMVECHSGYAYAERPVAFYWGDQRIEVKSIAACWHTPVGRIFRVCTLDERLFEIVYLEIDDEWKIKEV